MTCFLKPDKVSTMFEPSQLMLYIAAALVLALSPGPGLVYVAARTLSGGRKDGIASSLGTAFGGMVHVVAGSLGLSALVMANAELFSTLKLMGAFYLVWLGFRTIQTALRLSQPYDLFPDVETATSLLKAFREGVIVEALNPKTAAFFLAFIPQFIEPAQGHMALQFVVLGFLSVVLNTGADIAIVFVAHHIKTSVTTSPRVMRSLQAGSGGVMIALGVGLALADQ